MSAKINNKLFRINHKIDKNKECIYEKNHHTGFIYTKVLILKSYIKSKACAVPQWLIYLTGLLFALLMTIFISALLVLFKRPALLNESCADRSCSKEAGLKCVNKVCKCLSTQYYDNMCRTRKGYTELCQTDGQCKANTNLFCIGGACMCNVTNYWNGTYCLRRKTLGERCNGDQCLYSSMLYCSLSGKCECDLSLR